MDELWHDLIRAHLRECISSYQGNQRILASIMGYEGGEGMNMLPRKDKNKEVALKNLSCVIITVSGLLPESVSADMWPNILQQPHLLFDWWAA